MSSTHRSNPRRSPRVAPGAEMVAHRAAPPAPYHVTSAHASASFSRNSERRGAPPPSSSASRFSRAPEATYQPWPRCCDGMPSLHWRRSARRSALSSAPAPPAPPPPPAPDDGDGGGSRGETAAAACPCIECGAHQIRSPAHGAVCGAEERGGVSAHRAGSPERALPLSGAVEQLLGRAVLGRAVAHRRGGRAAGGGRRRRRRRRRHGGGERN
jgi:hypothetical protein